MVSQMINSLKKNQCKFMDEQISEIEKTGRVYKPDIIKLLYIAECPRDQSTHFYKRGTLLYSAMKISFLKRYPDFSSQYDFLEFFKEKKCYLLYLSYEPISKLSYIERSHKWYENILSLSEKIKECAPKNIVMIMKDLEKIYRKAIESSLMDDLNKTLSLPHITNEGVMEGYIEKNFDILKTLNI